MKKLVPFVALAFSAACSSAATEESAQSESKVEAMPAEDCQSFDYGGQRYTICDGPKGNFLATYRHFADIASGGDQSAGRASSIDLTKAVPAIGLPLGEARYDDHLKQYVQVFERVAMNGGPCQDNRACIMQLGRTDAEQTYNERVRDWTDDCNDPALAARRTGCLDPDFAATYERQGGLEFYGYPISHVTSCKVWPTNETASCFWTERAKLTWDGHQWIGEQLARKIYGTQDLSGGGR